MSSELVGDTNTKSLKCVLCRDAPKQPLLLICLHYTCTSCAKKAKGSVTCPACLVTTDCSTSRVDLLCSSLLQRSLARQSLNFCGPCSDEEKSETCAFSWCYDCQRSLCRDCDSEHQRQNPRHRRHAVDELSRSQELYRIQSRACLEDDKELSLACFTCYEAKCTICAHSCYKSLHDVLPLGHRAFAQRLVECKSHISDVVSSMSSSAVRLESQVNFLQSIVEARDRDIKFLDNAKRTVIDSLSRAYVNARKSLEDCYESVMKKAEILRNEAQATKERVQRTNEHWDVAQNTDDVLGFFTQLNVLQTSINELQKKVTHATDPIDAAKLVNNGVCLPDDLDQITSRWLGLAKLLKGDFGGSENEAPLHDGIIAYENTSQEAVLETPHFGAISDTLRLTFPCYDVSVTDDGHLLLAECKGHLLECTANGKELSRWRPKQINGEDEQVVSVETLSNGRAAVGVTYVNVVVILMRVYGAIGDKAWIENQRIDQLQITPLSLCAYDDWIAVAHICSNNVEVICLSQQQKHSQNERKYNIQSVAISDRLIITVSFSYTEPSSSKRPHVVEAHTRGGDDEQLLWRYELPDGDQARDVCIDHTGQVVYFTVGRTYVNSGRVTAVSALDGKVLKKDVLSFDKHVSPQKLSLRRAAKGTLLAVLANDSATPGLASTVAVYHSVVSETEFNRANMTVNTL